MSDGGAGPAGRSNELAATRTNTDFSERLAPGTRLAGRYTVVQVAGAGDMGIVYRARDEELGTDVALKVLRGEFGRDPIALERFRQELRLAREVSHKNVVRIHDIGEHEGLRFLTMRYVEGRSLREILEKNGPLPLDRAVAIALQLGSALGAAHDAGIVHRDLKPGNVLVDEAGSASVTDFGVARSFGGDGLTRAGAIVGTPDYLSPEQIAGDPIDGRTDLYALGIVFYEMLSGELPFRGGSQAEILGQRLGGRPRDISETGVRIPPAVRAVLRRLLEKSPARRYPDAGAFASDLVRAAARPLANRRRTLRLVASAAALAVAVAAGLLIARRPRGASRPASPGAPVAVRHAVAVLPLADETGDRALGWTATGVAEMLSARLAESPGLRVLDAGRVLSSLRDLHRPSRFDDRDFQELSGLWGVDSIVGGTIRLAGTRLRLDLKLARVGPGGEVSTSPWTREIASREGLFRLVSEAAGALAADLGASKPGPEARERPPASLAAAQAYAEGTQALLRGDELQAAPAFARAVEADPKFVAALERLAETYQSLGRPEQALSAGERALRMVGSSESRLAFRVRARVALLRGNPAEAEKSFQALLTRYPNDVEPRLDLSGALTAKGHSAEAVAVLRRAVEIDPQDPRAWFLLGKNSILAGDSSRAASDYLVRALALQSQLGNEKGKGDVWNAMGVAFQQLGDYPKALENYTSASAVRRALGDDRGLASTLRNRANVASGMGSPVQAEQDLRSAGKLFEKLGDRAGLSDVRNDFGVLYEARGEYGKALEAYQSALRIRRDLGDERLIAQSYDNVGYIFYLQGEYDNALVYWRPALDLRRKTGEKNGIVLSEQNLGFLQIAQGKWDAALKSFLESLEQSRETKFRVAEAISLGNLGIVNHYRGSFGPALESFREALAVAAKLDSKPTLSEFTTREGEALLDLGRLDAVAERITRVEAWTRETGNREQQADLETLRGRWQAARGERAAAARSLAHAISLAKESGSRATWLRARIAALVGPSPDTSKLASALAEAESLGHALLTIEAAEGLARVELGRGRTAPALAAVARARKVAGESGWGAGLYRLEALEAQILSAAGDRPGAAEALERSQTELSRLRSSLPEELRASFDALPEVRRIAGLAPGKAGR